MDTTSGGNVQRRNSIAGPFMRPTASNPGHGTLTQSTGSSNIPPPLSRSNSYAGGWVPSFWGRPAGNLNDSGRLSQVSSSSSKPIPIVRRHEEYSHLSASSGNIVTEPLLSPPENNRSSLLSSAGGPHTTTTSHSLSIAAGGESFDDASMHKRLSESANIPRSAGGEQETTTRPSILEADIRQGPIDTDLFWLVLRDIGE